MKHVFLTLTFLTLASLAHAQVTYFATYEGTGTEGDPFRAHSNIPGTECKSLRANETNAAGVALCSGPSLPIRAGVVSVDLVGTLSTPQKAVLGALLGRAVAETTIEGVLSAVLDARAVPLRRWSDGRQRIVIHGREIWSRPAPLASYLPDIWHAVKNIFTAPIAWAAATLSEDWNCADDTTPNYVCDQTWVLSTGSTATMEGNALRNTNSTSTNVLYSTSTLDATDMQHRVTVSSIDRGTATNVAGGPAIRNPGTGTSTYVYCVLRDAATDQVELGHVVTGSLTSDSTDTVTVANGDTIETIGIGDQVSCKHNSVTVLGPLTENTGSGNVNINVRFSGSGTATTTSVVLDDSFAELATAAATFGPLRRRGM
ncbi:MAG: hypothetical protein OEW25_01430 [Nitrospira sp.]|nr:hypothetical protein [Nitrospira sp.]